jgi:hypothetical protein
VPPRCGHFPKYQSPVTGLPFIWQMPSLAPCRQSQPGSSKPLLRSGRTLFSLALLACSAGGLCAARWDDPGLGLPWVRCYTARRRRLALPQALRLGDMQRTSSAGPGCPSGFRWEPWRRRGPITCCGRCRHIRHSALRPVGNRRFRPTDPFTARSLASIWGMSYGFLEAGRGCAIAKRFGVLYDVRLPEGR